MVKNEHSFIPSKYRPKPIGYRVEGHNQCVIFIEPQTKILEYLAKGIAKEI